MTGIRGLSPDEKTAARTAVIRQAVSRETSLEEAYKLFQMHTYDSANSVTSTVFPPSSTLMKLEPYLQNVGDLLDRSPRDIRELRSKHRLGDINYQMLSRLVPFLCVKLEIDVPEHWRNLVTTGKLGTSL